MNDFLSVTLSLSKDNQFWYLGQYQELVMFKYDMKEVSVINNNNN